ncbi:nuclear pore complex protein Nup98-Nup96-like [Uloborus diversus]|uniref:nuclear pore complex protein Nup98-Nup96-like n=1 Tax=Uloborus diversus TaxID=327109 RepID=UPI002409826B|nr:nuclear pore complex protein Nup98-Nup96-like [Uloborus diversus]
MFGNNKPFGTASAFGGTSFGGTSTPFGQNTTAFGAKPATSNVFGASAFGVSTPNTGGLFGTSTPASGTGLFGQPSTGFGAPASTSTNTFGFGATSNTGGLFGSTTPATQTSGGLFGASSSSAFGTPRPTFGGFGTATPGAGLFGQNTSTGAGLFGSAGFTATAPTGTTIKFNPTTGTDTMMKGGVSASISTRHQCITCMKEYENKSLEELRVEDYAANRKGGSAGAIGGFGNPTPQTGLFGVPAASSSSAFSFGSTTQAKPLFGTTGSTNTFGGGGGLFGQPAQNQSTGLFGKSVGFGAATTSAAPVFNFGASTGTSLFGQNNQQKPLFGQTTGSTGLFGNTATTQPSTGFGTSTGFGGFGATQPSTGLFGATKPTGFGTTNTTTTNTFSFGNTNNMGTGLFGQKTATPAFGTSAFGTQNTGFGAFGNTQTTGTGLFGQSKPATSAFGGTGSTFGTGLGSTFGNSTFSMGLGANTGTGLFGASTANKAPGFNFGGTGSTGFNFGATNPSASSFNFGTANQMPGSDPNNAVLQQAQQQILAMTVNPFGDSPLFRNPLKDSSREVEVLKPTNPSAQKALLNDNYCKLSLLPTAKIKPKPWTPPVSSGKMFFFDGLEDEEPSLGNISFQPKRSVKKLVLKNMPKLSSVQVTSDISSPSNQSARIDVSISLKNVSNNVNANSVESPAPVPLTIDISNSSNDNVADVTSTSEPSAIRKPASPAQESSNAPEIHHANSVDDSISALHTNKQIPNRTYKMWSLSDDTENQSLSLGDVSDASKEMEKENHNSSLYDTLSVMVNKSCPIILTKEGYFTVPPQSELEMDADGNCFVTDFTVGRIGYGKVIFPGRTNVAGLNIDEIVLFHKREINVYPNDKEKPSIGEGLNRKAVVILEGIWPTDKTTHSPIKDPERISSSGYAEKIASRTSRIGAKFIDYIPVTGSWIFEVDHFSKYGLEDSDDEMEIPVPLDNKTQKVVPTSQTQLKNGDFALPGLPIQQLTRKPIASMPSEVEEMEGITSQFFPQNDLELTNEIDDQFLSEVYSPTRPILNSDIDAERIQGMKAFFFQEEMEDTNWGSCANGTQKSILPRTVNDISGKQVFFTDKKLDITDHEARKRQKQLSFKVDDDLHGSFPHVKFGEAGLQTSMSSLSLSATKQAEWLSSFPLVKSSIQESVIQQKSVPLSVNKIYLKPLKKSVLYGKEHLLADAGYFKARSFRVGWKADGTFVSIQSFEERENLLEILPKFILYGDQITSRASLKKSGFSLSFEKLQMDSAHCNDTPVQKNLVDVFKLQLKHSASTTEENVPLFLPKPGTDLIHALSELFESQLKNTDIDSDRNFTRQSISVWNLLVSLWGKIRGLNEEDQDVSNYSVQMARREALSHWLIKTTENAINNKVVTNVDDLQKIFLSLTGRRISDAVKIAQKTRNFRLALLLSQAEGCFTVRKLLSCQLQNWEQNGAYKFIHHNMIMLYCLLAGFLLWENIYETVNCCKNLEWKQTLALHLWYHCTQNASIQEAVKAYDDSFQGTETNQKYSLPPYPDYFDLDAVIESEVDSTEAPDKIFDTCYHLLKLYCDRTHRFDQLLMPATYTWDHLDYRLSWFLQLSLTSLGFNISDDLSSTLHMNFASQLESINMWHWAIFVILHHPDVEWRKKSAKDILLRHVSLEQSSEVTEKENFLKNDLLIPESWIFEAKAIKAHSMNKRAEEAWFLLKAGYWNKSHDIVIKHLASDAVINEDYDYLLKYLSELSLPERSCSILDWASGGQVYLDYINMCRMVEGVLSRETSAYDLEKFTPQVISLCKRLSSVPTPNLKDRLSIAEMAKKTATILRSIAILQASRTKKNTFTSLTRYFKNLPMPYDYAESENRFLAHCFVEEVTSEI